MNNLYQGGACNPNAVASSNQYKRMMSQMGGGSQNPERVMQMSQKGQSFEDEIKQRELAFQAMNQGWGDSSTLSPTPEVEHRQHTQQMNGQMNEQYQNGLAAHQHMMMMQQQHWQKSQQEVALQGWRMQQEFEQASLGHEAEQWKNEVAMEGAFEEARFGKEEEQRNILDSSSSMLEVMMNDPDPRFKNSQFLHFLKRIQEGEVVIEGKEIKELKPDTHSMEQAWNEAELIQQSNAANLDPTFQQAKMKEAAETLKAQEVMEGNWEEKL